MLFEYDVVILTLPLFNQLDEWINPERGNKVRGVPLEGFYGASKANSHSPFPLIAAERQQASSLRSHSNTCR